MKRLLVAAAIALILALLSAQREAPAYRDGRPERVEFWSAGGGHWFETVNTARVDAGQPLPCETPR